MTYQEALSILQDYRGEIKEEEDGLCLSAQAIFPDPHNHYDEKSGKVTWLPNATEKGIVSCKLNRRSIWFEFKTKGAFMFYEHWSEKTLRKYLNDWHFQRKQYQQLRLF